MYVCLCKGVNDKTIHQAVSCGEVSSMRDLRQQYGVASQCGCCKDCAKTVLNEALQENSPKKSQETSLPVSVCYT
ncbi:(2Fe-2S)-binding protein [Idiomarina piscisalsi]|uniref:Bacterioferritin-associated ferredoxin n=1 Tax=Idiomarina piscisalsi TaxID=1096243 RepID=A0A432YN28_9GAMM|nr:(2Fe-2S)-binding protein [Idiomarina piscisalsi]RUO62350.1 (2Fe-2S)-binding protein [Idiomarina piscisalsi]